MIDEEDDASILAATVAEAQEVQGVREIRSAVHRRRIALATTPIAESLKKIDMHPEHLQREI